MDTNTGKAKVVVAPDDADLLGRLAHSILDDVAFNVVHDLLLQVHQQEKAARATTAAIRVEKLAYDSIENPVPDERPEIRIETDMAVYNSGEIYLKGNPLKTTKDILCPRCHLPRLLYPTEGNGARKPDPSIIYCKKHPYIDKPGFDIYGQTWVGPGPGRGKKKKEAADKKDGGGGGGSGGGGGDSPAPAVLDKDTRPANVLTFPSATCSKCKRCILVTRLNNHMGACIGNSGRNASRAAAQKISGNGNGNGHSSNNNDLTPPSSQKGTPLPGSRASSPKKRDVDDMDEDDDSETSHRKKKIKPAPHAGTHSATATASPLTKKVILKAKGGGSSTKKDRIKAGSSSLSQEHRLGDGGGGDGPSKKNNTPKSVPGNNASPAKKLKLANNSSSKPPATSSPLQRHKQMRDADGDSESSGMSSPPR